MKDKTKTESKKETAERQTTTSEATDPVEIAPSEEATKNEPAESAEPSVESRIEELSQQCESLKNQLLRKAAEFENYKRRMENDTATMVRYAQEGLIVELLSVIDDFERSMKAGKEHPDFESFYKGIELVAGKLNRILESRGLKRIVSIGQPFDVEYHDAMMQMHRDGVAPHTVIDEIEPGYQLFDKVIRHARVIVSADLPDDADANSAATEKQ